MSFKRFHFHLILNKENSTFNCLACIDWSRENNRLPIKVSRMGGWRASYIEEFDRVFDGLAADRAQASFTVHTKLRARGACSMATIKHRILGAIEANRAETSVSGFFFKVLQLGPNGLVLF
mmetsp:Transcript_3680/g.4222  ORF Transcript_3680/g.4222 Transcript_3680/m.4222 type:complete len:121 (-) Transcript_3680:942-1304(-)